MFTLATSISINRGFNLVRRSVLGLSGTFVSLAATLAGFLIGVKLIKLSYDLMSDEQGAGHGGVRLSQLTRPVVILMLICGYQYAVGFLDWGVGTLVNSINKTADGLSKTFTENIGTISDAIYEGEQNEISKPLKTVLDDASEYAKGVFGTDYTVKANEYVNGKDGLRKSYMLDNDGERMEGARARQLRRAIANYIKCEHKNAWDSDGGKVHHGFVTGFILWLFQIIYRIMVALAQIILCLMALLGPFVLAFSLIDKWQGSLIGYVGKYIETSMWTVVATLINWLVSAVGGLVTNSAAAEYAALANSIYSGAALGNFMSYASCLTTSAFVGIAGILAMISVPDITSAIFGLAGVGGGATGTASKLSQSVVTAPGQMAKKGAEMMMK